MSEKENQSPEDEDNLPVENEFLIELVEEAFGEVDADAIYDGLPTINREDFGVSESEEDCKKVLLITKDEILERIREIFKESNSFEQQRKKYRLEVIKSAENFTLYTIFGELKRDERKKLVIQNKDEIDYKDFNSFENEVYFDIVKSKFIYHIFLLILREQFGDGLEESFPSKLIYSLKRYGWHLFKSELIDNEDPEYRDELQELIENYGCEVEIEKKFLTQYGDEKFRDLFEFGFNEDLVSRN